MGCNIIKCLVKEPGVSRSIIPNSVIGYISESLSHLLSPPILTTYFTKLDSNLNVIFPPPFLVFQNKISTEILYAIHFASTRHICPV